MRRIILICLHAKVRYAYPVQILQVNICGHILSMRSDMRANGVNVCHASGYDTNEFGAATTARFGLAETYGNTNSIVYADACRIQPTAFEP